MLGVHSKVLIYLLLLTLGLIEISRSAAQMAWRRIFADHGTPEILSVFRQLFDDSDPSHDYNFTTLHQVVLNLDQRDRKTYLQTCSQTAINQKDAFGRAPLHWAAMRGDYEVVEMLLRSGADPSISSVHNGQALHHAVQRGDLRSIDLLLKYGADVNARDSYQVTPLLNIFSPSKADLSCIKRLIARGAMINAQDFQGATALAFAAQYDDAPGLETLLSYGAKVDLPTFDGETALTISVKSNTLNAISLLLAHGASLTQHTVSGRSLLHEAAEYGDQETLRLLTSAHIRGVKINHKSSDGITAWDLARQRSEVTPEWRDAFVDLIESVDESMPEPPIRSKISSEGTSIPRMQLSNLIRVIVDETWDGLRYVSGFASRLRRLRGQTLSTLLAVYLAFLWYIIMSRKSIA